MTKLAERSQYLYFIFVIVLGGGSIKSLQNMIDSLGDNIISYIIFPQRSEETAYFEQRGIHCFYYPWTMVCCYEKVKTNFLHRIYSALHLTYWSLRDTKHIMQIVRPYHIDIVHSNTSFSIVGFLLARQLRIPHVWHVRECYFDGFRYFLGKPVMRWLMSRSDKVIAVSKATYDYWQMKQMPNAVVRWDAVIQRDDILYHPRKKKYFLFCAYVMSTVKCPDFAVKAFALSGLKDEGYTLKMVGQEIRDDKLDLQALCSSLGVSSSVEFCGLSNKVSSYFMDATAFLMCSKIEAMGRVTVESMAYGCLVIGRDIGGTSELIEEGVTGLKFKTIEELAEKMRYVAHNDVSDMIKAAQEFALNNFCESDYARFMMNTYQDLRHRYHA